MGATGGSLIVTDATSWAAFWAQHVSGIPSPPPLPAVDFKQHAVLAQFMGQQVITGILFSIENVVFDGNGLQIDVLMDIPGAGCTFPPGTTCPFHIVTVAKPVALAASVLNGTVTFYSCP